mmetsp:Transcript_3726/g.10333  ORF Transcript_3726/g.10333 Transcript_3726/m.10333 type:complete len:252 (-) Transcript_3726:579-1334(-)
MVPDLGAYRCVHHEAVGHLPSNQRVPSAGDHPDNLRRLDGPALATPAPVARAGLAAVVCKLEAVLDAHAFAPLVVLIARVIMTLPWCCHVRDPLPLPGGLCERGLRRRGMDRVHTQVAEHGLAGIVPIARFPTARRLVHPRHGLRGITPICDPQGHSGLHRIGEGRHVLVIATFVRQSQHPLALPQDRAHADQMAAILRKLRFQHERAARVDHIPLSGAISILHVLCALSAPTAVAIRVVPVRRRIACVRC